MESFEIRDCIFAGFGGGAFSLREISSPLKLTGLRFEGNTARAYSGGGGAMNIESCSKIILSDSVFLENRASKAGATDGGGIFVSSNIVSSKLEVVNCVFQGNAAGPLLFSDEELPDSVGRGGAIFVSRSGVLNVEQSHFTEDSAPISGGAVAITAATAKLSGITMNGSKTKDAAITCTASFVNMVGTTVTRTQGGGRATGGAFCQAEIDRCAFIENTMGGGLMFETASNIKVMSSTFVHNSAPDNDGGAILCNTCEKLHITDNTLFLDNAAERGGALAVVHTLDAVVDKLTTFKRNTATQGGGGGLYWVESEPVSRV